MLATVRITFVVVTLMVLAASAHAGVRVQMEVQGDGVSNTIFLAHPFLTGNPNALIIVSQSGWEDPGSINVYYSGGWRVYSNSIAPIPASAIFWVLAFDGCSGLRHTATASNTAFNYTVLDDPRLNGNPEAHPIVTPDATSGPAIPWPIGV